jgi:hypothetical protein
MRIPSATARRGVAELGGAAIVAALLLALASCALGTENMPASRAVVGRGPVHPVPVTLRSERGAMTTAPSPAIPITRTPRPDSLKINRLLRDAIRARPGASDTVLVTFRDPFASDTALIHHFTGKVDQRRPTSAMLKAISDSLVAARPHLPATSRRAALVWRHGAAGTIPPRAGPARGDPARRHRQPGAPAGHHPHRSVARRWPAPMREGDYDSPHRRNAAADPTGAGPVGGPGRQARPSRHRRSTQPRLAPPRHRADLECPGDVHSPGSFLRVGRVLVPGGYRHAGRRPARRARYIVGRDPFCKRGHGAESAGSRARIDSYRVYDPPNGAGNAGVNWQCAAG